MASFTERLLAYYELSEEEYGRRIAPPSFSSLPLLDGNPLVKTAIARLDKAKAAHEKVLIYGDYDTDGIMSCSILLRSFRRYGLMAEGYLPSRYLDGYGLTAENVDKMATKGFRLIFTCDNGVTAYEALNEAAAKGIDVIILDHHEFGEETPKALAVIHPETVHYGATPISAGYLSFIFATALLKEKDDYLLTLASLSTLSDMMPLKEYNREIVRLGLAALQANRYPEIVALSDKRHYDSKTLQMEVIPKINAIGRVVEGTEINRLLHYFADEKGLGKQEIAAWLLATNEERKAQTKTAESQISVDPADEAIVVQADIPEGLNGLLANRLLNEYEKPVAVFSPMAGSPDVLVGSLRSKEGFNILKALEGQKVKLLSGGGHAFAGGVSIAKSDFAAFKKEFIFAALKHKLAPKTQKLIPLELAECTEANAQIVDSFGPYGMEWEEPRFLLKGLDPKLFTYASGGKYLSYRLPSGARLFSFTINEDTFSLDESVSLSVSFSHHEYQGRLSLDLLAEKV
jgi:single-stranded-DNA-specific exonuclease